MLPKLHSPYFFEVLEETGSLQEEFHHEKGK
jgi:hypothetical protein